MGDFLKATEVDTSAFPKASKLVTVTTEVNDLNKLINFSYYLDDLNKNKEDKEVKHVRKSINDHITGSSRKFMIVVNSVMLLVKKLLCFI